MAKTLVTLQSAIDAVARRIIKRTITDGIDIQRASVEWEDYPEIGEHDWDRVLDRAQEIADSINPADGEYEAAYQQIAGRAEAD